MKPNPNAESLDEMLRVDHAGEYGANRIYEGQLLVLGKSAIAPTLKHMLAQEQAHLQKMNELMVQNKVRPSALMPLWYVAGKAIGIGSALLGEKAALQRAN
jgi:ubiquinone biosynthesis monooxygenase Coq7